MPIVYDSGRHVYIEQPSNDIVQWSRVTSALSNHNNRLNARVDELANALSSQRITPQQWVNGMRATVKDAYIASYLAGKGGRNNMQPSDWGRVGGLLSNQYRYLNRFSSDIFDNELSEAQIAARARLYIASSTQAFERAKAADRSISLPAYPGDGTSECMANCKCDWSIIEFDDRWEASWMLSQAEHCDTCISRSTLWSPLIIMKAA